MYPQTLTVSSVGQITLPKSVRKLLGLEKGTKLELSVDEKAQSFTVKRRKTNEEIFAELERMSKNHPKPDPRAKHMSVGEMSLELAKDIEGDTWV